jgi:SEC-C motif
MTGVVPFREREPIEWIGGRHQLAFGPSVVLWLELPRGVIVGSTLGVAANPVSLATCLTEAMQHPHEGPPRRPSRIRVADESAARELRVAAGWIPIVIAPVPELDATFDELDATLEERAPAPSYLGDGNIAPGAVAEMFKAAALLFRTAPWRRVSDAQILRVDIPRLGIDGACLSVIGAAGESLGLLLFESIDDYHAFAIVPDERAPRTTRLALRSLSFSTADELMPSLVAEIERHRWTVADASAYPLLICVGADQFPIAVSEKDVNIMTAVTRAFLAFFARHRDIFDSDDPELLRESSDGGDGLTITLTAPSTNDEAPVVYKAGRNDPCPCGSGKKYKKCHLAAAEATRATSSTAIENIHEMDHRLVRALWQFASSRYGPECLGFDPEDEPEDSLELLLPWVTWTLEVEGKRLADEYVERTHHLAAEDREWFAAQRASWLSVWEVTAVEWGKIDVRDLLTGETRSVRDDGASRSAGVRDTLLTRVIDYRGVSYFGGTHSRPLPPPLAADVIEVVRKKMRARKLPVSVERLRDQEIGWFLIDCWNDAVADVDSEGDPVPYVIDTFRFDAAMRPEIENRLKAMEEFGAVYSNGDEREYVFARGEDGIVTGVAFIEGETLRIETDSESLADALAGRVRETCGGLLQEPERRIEAVPDAMDGVDDEEATLLEFKTDHYRKWLDMRIPALGGKTPREAARSAKSRRALDLLLREMADHESRVPEAAQFDFAPLRRELGLEE